MHISWFLIAFAVFALNIITMDNPVMPSTTEKQETGKCLNRNGRPILYILLKMIHTVAVAGIILLGG